MHNIPYNLLQHISHKTRQIKFIDKKATPSSSLKELLYFFIQCYSTKNIVSLLCWMIAVPKYVVRRVRACVYDVAVAQNAHFYIPCAAASFLCHFETIFSRISNHF
ncbi:hypothetical protein V8G54_001661 [Vigna mungo]|uniref:Uncharacterized protein n=1 Tax=Vigna mungo TaxID=3915 RepID=A0AAQ3SA42_VIGMU